MRPARGGGGQGRGQGWGPPAHAIPPLRVSPRIDASENQVDETIFVLESFIESTVKRP